jgi:hypothetical protein
VTQEHNMPPSAAAPGFPAYRAVTQQGGYREAASPGEARSAEAVPGSPGASCQARLAGLLRDAATATERSWRGILGQEELDLGVLGLAAALGDLSVLCARLSACSRLQAMSEPVPRAFARAALVHTAATMLRQAWLALLDATPGIREDWQASAAGTMQLAARRALEWWQPAATVDDQALELLAEAIGALASGVGALADSTAGPLGRVLAGVQACVAAAAGQLRAA